MTNTRAGAEALAIIRELAEQGHTETYIAEALNRRKVPTLSGRAGARWNRGTVYKLAKRHGIERGQR